MTPSNDGGFAAEPHITYPVQVSFDADGQHYDLRATTHVLPVCGSIVALYIDDQMRLSVRAAPEFAW
jgi:hypothetical protein